MGESDSNYIFYRTITPAGLERNLGNRAGTFLSSGKREFIVGVIDYNSSGELCLKSKDRYFLPKHGDAITLQNKGKVRGSNRIRDYVFIDESD